MLKASGFRRHYLAMGSQCIYDEKTWQELVQDVLKRENIKPHKEHFEVMNCVRRFYLKNERAPSVGEICNYTGISLEDFFILFPDWLHTLFIADSIVSIVLEIPVWNVEMF